jgi:hypothetical protein
MLYLLIIIFSIIIALLRGGEMDKLSHISINGVYIFATALLLRVLIWIFEALGFSPFFQYSSILLIASYLLLVYISFKNINLPGFKYIALGLILNSFVIIVNGGKMPVIINQQANQYLNHANLSGNGEYIIHILRDSNTLFAFLGDVIMLPKPLPDTSILSVGDIMIFIGLFVLIQKTMMQEEGLQ